MSYRNKLFLVFNLITFVSVATGLSIIYTTTYQLVFSQIKSELLSIGLMAAKTVNGDFIKTLTTEASTQTPTYEALVDRLRWIRNTNRRPDFYVKYIYLMTPTASTLNSFYILDVEENPNIKAYYHEVVSPRVTLLQNIKAPVFEVKGPSYQEWGSWISIYIPIYDSNHTLVAILGMDASSHHTENQLRNLLFLGIGALIIALIASSIVAYFLSKLTTTALNKVSQTVHRIGHGDFKAEVHLQTHDEFDELGHSINEMAVGLAQKERLTKGFSRYVSHHVLETILKSTTPTKLEGEKRKVVVMFSDIRHFTKMSEYLPPETVVSFLNAYFEKMIAIIFAHHGTLDKFIGDGSMAEFGMPLDDPDQELNAIKTAIEMQRMVTALATTWKQQGLPPIRIGIGIHSGEAIVGNIGSDVRMEYTAVGDTVYVAAGLEGQTKLLHEEIIISEEVYKKVATTQEFSFKDLGLLHLPEREHPIRGYAITLSNTPR